jgi:hypothetical protein
MHEDHSTIPEESKSITNFGMLYSVAVISILNQIQRKVKPLPSCLMIAPYKHTCNIIGPIPKRQREPWPLMATNIFAKNIRSKVVADFQGLPETNSRTEAVDGEGIPCQTELSAFGFSRPTEFQYKKFQEKNLTQPVAVNGQGVDGLRPRCQRTPTGPGPNQKNSLRLQGRFRNDNGKRSR